MYKFLYTERNNEKATEFETKSLLYLLSMREDSDEIDTFFIDCFNDVTGTNKNCNKLWDVQSKGSKSLNSKKIGKALITLFENYISDINFHFYILFFPKINSIYFINDNQKVFGIENFKENHIQKLKNGGKLMLANKLKIGDTIGIVSSSAPITPNRKDAFNIGIKNLNKIGLKVKLGKYVEKCTLGYSATKEEKAEDINRMVLNKDVKAIFSSKGGENSFSCLELIDYENIKSNPKIIYGISDATNYLNAIYAKTGLVTFHQSDIRTIEKWSINSFEKQDFILRLIKGQIGKINKNSSWKCLRSGCAEGTIIGGNLKSIINLINTEYMPDFNDKILFLEAYTKSTPLELVDCYLSILKYHGVFNKIKGLWIGYYKGDTDNLKFEDVVMENLKKFNFPILKCDDFGHDCDNIVIPIGGKVKLDSNRCEVEIIDKVVE